MYLLHRLPPTKCLLKRDRVLNMQFHGFNLIPKPNCSGPLKGEQILHGLYHTISIVVLCHRINFHHGGVILEENIVVHFHDEITGLEEGAKPKRFYITMLQISSYLVSATKYTPISFSERFINVG